MTKLAETLQEVRRRIERIGKRPMNEENTKATLIEPVLRLEENRIEVLWRAHFVDRQVRGAIEHMFSPDNNDMLLVNYVASRTKNLTAEEIRGSIGRCHVSLDFPVDLGALVVGLVCSRDSSRIVPAPSSTHRWLCLSPRSMPIVSRGSRLIAPVVGVTVPLARFAAVMVASVMAGLR
jgi:hypothetical protein